MKHYNVMNQIKAAKLREEVFLTLIEAAAKQGQFNRDVLKGGTDVQALAKHYKGVSEIVIATYAEGEDNE